MSKTAVVLPPTPDSRTSRLLVPPLQPGDRLSRWEFARRYGVQEYLVWEVYDGRITWFYLDEGEYQPLPPDNSGIFRSRVFPGLWLAAADLLRNELTAVLQTVQAGLQTDEHKQFVAQINQR